VASLVVGALALVGLGACSAPPTPNGTARALAAGIASGDLTDVVLAGATPAAATKTLTAATAGMTPKHPAVTVDAIKIAAKGATATAALHYTWDLDSGDKDWTYTTKAHFELVKDVWQATWSPYLIAPDLVEGETLSVGRKQAERAPVLGAAGAKLVESRPVVHLGFDKTRVDAAGQSAAATKVAAALKMDPVAFVARVAAAGEKAFVEGFTIRADDTSVDKAAFALLPGASAVPGTLPLASSKRFARPILGTVGPATAEIVAKSDGAIVGGDETGLSGLQRQYDKQLRGMPGLTVVATAADGVTKREVFAVEGTVGEPLVTTLVPALQESAETILEKVVPASAIVAIQPSTGAVLAAASGPGGGDYSTATVAKYAPGSVFKVISSLALLRTGLTPDSPVTCPVTINVEGRAFSNFPGYPTTANGTISLKTAVANSCNTAFIGSRDLAPQSALVSAAASLGLGGIAPLGYPAYQGSVPADATGTDHAASMIGQSRIEVSPLAMATVAASVARGQTVVPRLVGAKAAVVPAPAVPLTAAEATALRTMMRAVVTDGGAKFLLGLPGGDVMAKTGTAQYGSAGNLQNHTWMIAIQGDLAVAVFVETGELGSTTSGPLLKAFLTAAHG
jgi:cell division protein FtsI/penicillin-binding protein 2